MAKAPFVPQSTKSEPTEWQFGWRDDPVAVAQALSEFTNPVFSTCARVNKIEDQGKGRIGLLHKAVEGVAGYFPCHNQGTGDCTSHSGGLGVDVVKSVRIASKNLREEFRGETATEPIYGAGRVEIARRQLGREKGSTGAWTVAGLKGIGTLVRRLYTDKTNPRLKLDLTNYSARLADKLGYDGVPDWLEPTAREHPILTASLIRGFDELADAINVAGSPVLVCSMVGFNNTRDRYGFAKESGEWPHAMLFIACNYSSDPKYRNQQGALCMNSWGPNWISGPKTFGQPDGSFWVTPKTVDRMLRHGDSWALSGFIGFPAQDIPEGSILLV